MTVTNDLAEITGTARVRASKARFAFASNSVDVTVFYALHQHLAKVTAKRVRRHAYVLNKATYVLVESLWEAYCEDIVAESLGLLTDNVPTWRSLPRRLARDIAKEVTRNDATVLAPWELAGDGWRQFIRDRQAELAYERNYDFQGPKSANIERFFSESLGLTGIRDIWRNAEGSTVCQDLDRHIDRRNSIVHEITPGPAVNKSDVKEFYNIVRRLVRRTDQAVDDMLIRSTGVSHWKSYVRGGPVEIACDDLTPGTNDAI